MRMLTTPAQRSRPRRRINVSAWPGYKLHIINILVNILGQEGAFNPALLYTVIQLKIDEPQHNRNSKIMNVNTDSDLGILNPLSCTYACDNDASFGAS